MQAIGKNVILKEIKDEPKAGSLLLPEQARTTRWFKVISKSFGSMELAVGDCVYCPTHRLSEVNIEGEIFFHTTEEAIVVKR